MTRTKNVREDKKKNKRRRHTTCELNESEARVDWINPELAQTLPVSDNLADAGDDKQLNTKQKRPRKKW